MQCKLQNTLLKINSTKNSKVKELLILKKRKILRDRQNLFIVEGHKEIQIALKKYRPHELFLYKKSCVSLSFIVSKFPLVLEINRNIYLKLIYKKDSIGVGTFHRHDLFIEELQLPGNPILLILVGIEKPGNLGAIFRSAEAIGTDVILLSEIKTDIFHPNAIRSSLGTIFNHNIVLSQSNKLIKWLIKKKIKILATYLRKRTINFYKNILLNGISIIIGNESLGLSDYWITISDSLLKLPMHGNLNSLNVSNAVAIILFEILRQRI